MPTPTRPSTGAPIESSWGQELHDQAFLPAGGRWHSQSTLIGTVQVPVALVADDDPGVWLSAAGATQLVVPADGDGLYVCELFARPTAADTGAHLYHVHLNGAPVVSGAYDLPSNTAAGLSASGLLKLAVGDILQFLYWQRPTAAGRLDLQRWTLTRVGRAWGLP